MSKKQSSSPWVYIAGAAVAGALFLGILNYVKSGNAPGANGVEPTAKQGKKTPDVPKLLGEVKLVKFDRDGQAYLASSKTVPNGTNPIEFAVSESVKEAEFSGVRVLGIDQQDQLVIVDMNSVVLDGLGSSGEQDLIATIKLALSQFETVSTFKIRVDGQLQNSLGHGDMSNGIPVR